MNIKTTYSRGKARLENLASLPCIDQGGEVKYFGSISKTGDNADWDWGMYQDEKGEWVLAEADGPGCIFNFTQHRYPTSEVPSLCTEGVESESMKILTSPSQPHSMSSPEIVP